MSSLDSLMAPSSGNGNQDVLLENDGWGERYPGLYDFLCKTMHNGNPRLPGRLGIAIRDGKAQIRFSDDTSGRVAFFVSESLEMALDGSDKAFQEDRLDWRQDKYAKAHPAKRA